MVVRLGWLALAAWGAADLHDHGREGCRRRDLSTLRADVQNESHDFRGIVCVVGTSAMIIADYIAIGFLVACMLGAGAMAISRGKS
jgi:hypothetical protein